MKRFIPILALVAALATADPAHADTTFTYQAKLKEAGAPVTVASDFRFRLFDGEDVGTQLGSELEVLNVAMADDGTFTVDLDFGNQFNGNSRWLEVDVRTPHDPSDTAPYTTLLPRQPIHAAPFAIYALNGATNGWTDKGGVTHTMDSIGIGTTSPAAQLHIDGTGTSAVGFRMEAPGSASGYIAMGSPLGHTAIAGAANNGHRRDIRFTNSGLAFSVGSTTTSPPTGNGLFIHESGNVGVGTTDPQHLLHVGGILRVGGTTVGVGGANGDYLYFQPNSTGLASLIFHQEKLRISNAYGEIMRLFRGGDVSIGSTSSPGARLGITRTNSGTVLRTTGSGSGTGINVSSSSIGVQVTGLASTGTAFHVPSITGSARAASFYGISSSPMITSWNDGSGIALHVRGPNDASLTSDGIFVSGDTAGLNIVMDNNEIIARDNGATSILHLNAEGGEVRIGQNSGGTGLLRTPVLQITGGADFSEMFDVGGEEDIVPGTVVVIDPDNAGRLIPSSEAYDAKVAGIISGAGGVATGMRMGHDGTIADGEHPVALSGRVYCLVDATEHGVRPGDMLTTSLTPGHAMKASDRERAYGAVIGKAMTSLDKGETGLVLVLISLQ